MSLDTRYMIAPSLQEIFLDKETGLPLVGGVVTYYSDNNRVLLKPIYTLSGNAPDYTYVEIPNPNTLSSIGTTTDANGNDVLPYYFPYDADGNPELYYITVESATAVDQFTRSAYPNFASGSVTPTNAVDLTNYIPNGQFLSHTNIPATSITVAGQITEPETPIAYGGWYFERSGGSTAVDIVTFIPNTSFQSNPSFSPRYSCNITCTSPDAGDEFKYLSVRFNDVNKFADASQQYTFCFNAFATTQLQNIGAAVYKNYGTGGSLPTITNFKNFNLTTLKTAYAYSLNFGTNSGQTIGSLNDDYLELVIQLPVGFTFNATFTDFMLLQGSINPSGFVPQTNEDMLTRSVTGGMPVPDPAGFDLYLPLTLTPTGMIFDDSQISKIYASSSGITQIGELLCDGSSYIATQYSSDGIPYARLQQKYLYQPDGQLKNPSGIPLYGTGLGYFTGVFVADTANEIILHNNTAGSVTNTSDGSNPTNFTFSVIGNGAASYLVDAYWDPNVNTVFMRNQTAGAATATNVGTSGFAVLTYIVGNAEVKNVSIIDTTSATGLGGKYWTFNNTVGNFYVWYKVDGTGADPAPGGTGILVNLHASDTNITVAQKTANTLNAWEVTDITTQPASGFTTGAYFIANSTSGGYYIWYTINGIGTDPAVAGRTGIKVAVLSADTAEFVGIKTVVAINAYSYAVPNYQGLFLRGTDSTTDVDVLFRASLVDYAIAPLNRLGTIQFDTNQYHQHITSSVAVQVDLLTKDKLIDALTAGAFPKSVADGNTLPGYDFSTTTSLIGATAAGETGFSGWSQSQPINANVMYLVKY